MRTHILLKSFLLVGLVFLAFPWSAKSSSDAAKNAHEEFFESKVRPLLVKNCYACHTDLKSGGLRLDTREYMLMGGRDGPVVVPGDPDHSLLVTAIHYTSSKLKMPPSGRLSDDDIAILERWIRDGTVWSSASPVAVPSEYTINPQQRSFWSFQPVRNSVPPRVSDHSWVKSPIDAFILAKLEANGLKPVGRADKRTLIRRATLDSIGLPPTPEEVEAFVRDSSPRAFEKVVDRLLASPHYGERWGRYWLDIARYADDQLNATEDKPVPNAFHYRDWVVQALNDDMPYDQFVKAQIAGDLMPNCDTKRFVGGLGFYALSPNPEFHEDRVDVTGRGLLGLTVACAECHNHKYDPVPTKDYYSLLGVFENTQSDEFPLVPAHEVEDYKKAKQALDDQKAEFKEFLDNQRKQLDQILADQTADYMVAAWRVLGPEKKSVEDVVQVNGDLDHQLIVRWVDLLKPGNKHEYPFLDAWQRLLEKGAKDPVARNVAEAFQGEIQAALKEQTSVDEMNVANRAKTKPGLSPELVALKRNSFLLLQDLTAGPDPDKIRKGKNGIFYFTDAEMARFFTGIWREHYDALRARIERMQASLPPPYPFMLTIKDKPNPVNLHVYIRGDKENQGEEAPRRFLAILSEGKQEPFKQGSGRLELAEAIANPRNPLTARVMVNRIWEYHFGEGIVRTPSNFGKTGEPPTHAELLDYLASRFMENGWSIKKMHRDIMLSSVYMLSADYSADNFKVDPDNKLLWRTNVRRLDCEAIRDSMLFVSGKLDPAVGGPAIPLDREDNTRRTLYGYVSRRKLEPYLRLFDFPDPNGTSEQRLTTNVPLQELFFLNSGFVEAQATALSQRIGSGSSDQEKIQKVYHLLFGRSPSSEEAKDAKEFLAAGAGAWPQYVHVLLSSNQFIYTN